MEQLKPAFRPARIEDSQKIAELFKISSGGVADYVWSTLALEYPGLSLLEVGARRYASDQTVFSYKNCVVVENDGEVIGMLVSFPISDGSRRDTERRKKPAQSSTEPDVLAPYNKLEAPGSWYICAMAVSPEFRGQGLGTKLLEIARRQARDKGFHELSLIAFEQNTGAVRLYERNGFTIVDRAAVVPHKLIHYTGDALLMTAPV
ncbi:MAG: GNAT family N-acetyltransferase [Acidiferrobacterales bacterium]